MTHANIPKDMNFNFFENGTTKGPGLLVHQTAVLLNTAAYKLIEEPPGLKIGISEEERMICVWPITKAGEKDVIYLSEYNIAMKKCVISAKNSV